MRRRVELASDLRLDALHEIIQSAFGWTDSHLHRFARGSDIWSDEGEHYLCPFEIAEGEQGTAEERARLDYVLTNPGDELRYVYDFGDDWQHSIELEAVEPRTVGNARAVCTTGERPGAPEDCGGVEGYELIAAASDSSHEHHAAALTELVNRVGSHTEAFRLRTITFDIDAVNRELADITGDRTVPHDELPAPLAELSTAVRSPRARRTFRSLLAAARPGEPVDVDVDTARRMVRPYLWLLERVGTDGIKLTQAGYLPPRHVEAAMPVIDPDSEWIGKGNREDQTFPVLDLRQSAQRTGLLRKYKGTLLLTKQGRSLRDSPVALWTHLAERTPPPRAADVEHHAGVLLLSTVAAQVTDGMAATVAGLLSAIGWVDGDGRPLDALLALSAAPHTRGLLRRLGALQRDHDSTQGEQPTSDGATFARAALTHWPGQP